MSSVTLHPFGAGPVRNRAIAPANASANRSSAWQRLAARYWAGWEHYARTYGAELDQRAALPLPDEASASAPKADVGNRWISIR